MCIGCEDFLEQKSQVFTKAALLLIPKHNISHEDHKDLVQSAYLRVLERKKIDPTIVSKPDNYLTTLVERLSIDNLRRTTVTVDFDEFGNEIRKPWEQAGVIDEDALMQHEALARERYLADFPRIEDRRNQTERVNELYKDLKSPEERDLFLSLYNQESVEVYAQRKGINKEAAKKRRKRSKEKLAKRFRGGRHG